MILSHICTSERSEARKPSDEKSSIVSILHFPIRPIHRLLMSLRQIDHVGEVGGFSESALFELFCDKHPKCQQHDNDARSLLNHTLNIQWFLNN